MPGATTILENVNAISNETRQHILNAQMELVLKEGLDDFDTILLDSTSVEANSGWPTDSGILLALLRRTYHYSQKLELFGVCNFREWWVPSWLGQLKKLLFKINMSCGKRNSKGKLKRLYRRFLQTGQKVHEYLIEERMRVGPIIRFPSHALPVSQHQRHIRRLHLPSQVLLSCFLLHLPATVWATVISSASLQFLHSYAAGQTRYS